MALYQLTPKRLDALVPTSFGSEGIMERRDLQRLLREQIAVLDEDLFVVAEEFGDWVDSSRRIDLLCIDKHANLVVVELKRTEDGGHMELQALRYAAMISAMTFQNMVDAHVQYSTSLTDQETAQSRILAFLDWAAVDEELFGRETRIILASADFGKELTTTVMWLIDYGIDVRCLRLKPYRMADGAIVIDAQQLIPLPEASDFQTKIGNKRSAERQNRSERHELRRRFWVGLLAMAKPRTGLHAGRSATDDNWIAAGIGKMGFSLTYSVRQSDCQVELYIALGSGQRDRNKAAFRVLEAQRNQVEAEFGDVLDWQELPDGDGSRIRHIMPGGYRSDEREWPAIHERMIDAMIRLDRAVRGRVVALST